MNVILDHKDPFHLSNQTITRVISQRLRALGRQGEFLPVDQSLMAVVASDTRL